MYCYLCNKLTCSAVLVFLPAWVGGGTVNSGVWAARVSVPYPGRNSEQCDCGLMSLFTDHQEAFDRYPLLLRPSTELYTELAGLAV